MEGGGASTTSVHHWVQAPIEKPVIRETKQDVYEQKWLCPECREGYMICENGLTVGFNTYWNHRCDKCGHRGSAESSFPKIVYKDKPKLVQSTNE